MTTVQTKRSPFLMRLWRSYSGWRGAFGRRESFIAAWDVTDWRLP